MTFPLSRMAGAPAPARTSKSLEHLLNDVGVDRDVLRAALIRLAERGLLTRGPQELSAAEVAFMDAHSGTKPNPVVLFESRIQSEFERAADLDEAMTVSEVASLLGVSPSRVRHRLSAQTLYAYPSAGTGVGRLIPRWQFVGGKEVPHLGEVLRALPAEFTPMDVKAFVLNARVDHPTRDVTVGLLDWLSGGNDPAEAIALADDQQHTI